MFPMEARISNIKTELKSGYKKIWQQTVHILHNVPQDLTWNLLS